MATNMLKNQKTQSQSVTVNKRSNCSCLKHYQKAMFSVAIVYTRHLSWGWRIFPKVVFPQKVNVTYTEVFFTG